MAKPTQTLDDLFSEYEADRSAEVDDDAGTVAKREAKRRAEFEKEVRQGLRDAKTGDWIEQPEDDNDDEDEDNTEED